MPAYTAVDAKTFKTLGQQGNVFPLSDRNLDNKKKAAHYWTAFFIIIEIVSD